MIMKTARRKRSFNIELHILVHRNIYPGDHQHCLGVYLAERSQGVRVRTIDNSFNYHLIQVSTLFTDV